MASKVIFLIVSSLPIHKAIKHCYSVTNYYWGSDLTTKCQNAFDKGKANRELNPLSPGTSKLSESYGTWRRQYDGLNLIESALEDKINIPDDYQLGGWTGADWRGELKRLPEDLAEDLGYRILPGVLSLCDYATATPETAKLAARAEKKHLILLICANGIGPLLLAPQSIETLVLKELVLLDTWLYRF